MGGSKIGGSNTNTGYETTSTVGGSNIGRSKYIDDPRPVLWSLLDRADVEVDQLLEYLRNLSTQHSNNYNNNSNNYLSLSSYTMNRSQENINMTVNIPNLVSVLHRLRITLLCIKASVLILIRYDASCFIG